MATKYISINDTLSNFLEEYLSRHSIQLRPDANTSFKHYGGSNPRGPVQIMDARTISFGTQADGFTPLIKQQIKLSSDVDVVDHDDFVDYVEANFNMRPVNYRDSTIYLPNYDRQQAEDVEKEQLFNKIYSYYNFKTPIYEDFTRLNAVAESQLPMHLISLYRDEYPESAIPKVFLNYNISSDIDKLNINRKMPESSNKNFKMFTHHRGYDHNNNYFNRLAIDSNRGFATNNPDFGSRKVFVNFNFTKESYKKVYDVPFYNSIHLPFDVDRVGDFTKYIIDNGLSDLVMYAVDTSPFDVETFNYRSGVESGQVQYRTQDLNKMIVNIDIADLGKFADENLILYDETNSVLQYENPDVLVNALKMITFSGMMTLFKDQGFNFKSLLLNKKLCYNELIGYKVTKTSLRTSGPTDTYYFFNFGGNKDFIDTQVKFGTSYQYDVEAIYMVVGAMYKTSVESIIPGSSPSKPSTAAVNLEIMPDIKIMQIPVARRVIKMVEPPPLEPIVTIENSKFTRNKIQITLDEREGVAISKHDRRHLTKLEDDDQEYITNLEEYMGSEFPYYSHVASGKTYEIYRLETVPKKISDFAGNLYYLLENREVDVYGNKKRSRLTFNDYLEHDKTYYYMFRALSHNGNPSNPSPVYAVEKTRDSDETFLKVQTIELENEEQFSMDTSFRRFMSIAIRDEHLEYNEKTYKNVSGDPAESAKFSNLTLGEAGLEDVIWNYNDLNNNYIKLRLESKNSGKKIDLNLIFNYNQPKNNN